MNKNANGNKNETLNKIFSFGSGDWHTKKLRYFGRIRGKSGAYLKKFLSAVFLNNSFSKVSFDYSLPTKQNFAKRHKRPSLP